MPKQEPARLNFELNLLARTPQAAETPRANQDLSDLSSFTVWDADATYSSSDNSQVFSKKVLDDILDSEMMTITPFTSVASANWEAAKMLDEWSDEDDDIPSEL